jgi:secreted PhoX family phosphatase
MSKIGRRKFLSSTLQSGAGLGILGLLARAERFQQLGRGAFAGDPSGYGTLAPTPAQNTGEVLLALPPAFNYNVIGRAGSPMTDGTPTPALHDGMSAFDIRGSRGAWALVRNHENAGFAGSSGAVSGTPPYDALAAGGTTTLVINKRSRSSMRSFTSLSGTVRNCSGGRTPWNTWISCEETTAGPLSGFQRPHGYCFEVDPARPDVPPIALTQMGRFRHEAAAVDPLSGNVYLTEDSDPAGFYRFVPSTPGSLALGGQLEMLAVSGGTNVDLRSGQTVGTELPVHWVPISEPDPASAETDALAVYRQGADHGGAIFRRLEGCFADNGFIYFVSTNGGNSGYGQVWRYSPSAGTLRLIFESPDAAVLDFPDNICFGPRGRMFLCEDGGGGDNYLRMLNYRGVISDLAKNIIPGYSSSEFAGACFSPDQQTMFVNVQNPGLTFAIWGPF